MNIPTEEICFIRSDYYCISFIKTVPPPEAIEDSEADRKYYSIVFNTISAIAKSFDAKIIKNVGDGLVWYFPRTSNSTDESAFNDVIECGLTIIAALPTINAKLLEENLPTVNYRISADYGKVEVAKSATSGVDDLFGSPMNLCAKINSLASVNRMVIGNNLYQFVRRITSSNSSLSSDYGQYQFEQISKYTWGKEQEGQESNASTQNYGNNNNRLKNIPYSIFSVSSIDPRKLKDNTVNQHKSQSQQKQIHNIMVVDDDQDILYTYEAFLDDAEHYHVETFNDPQEALMHFAQLNLHYYDLVILDIRMPRFNGLQLYYKLKAIDKDVKVIFLSALEATEEIMSIFPTLQSKDIIRKPIEKVQFVNRINMLLQH
jgi:two-component system, OmpR family, response regulator ChvI